MNPDQNQLQEFTKQYGQVIAKAWADDEFKARLLADPASVLKAEGIAVPDGVELRAVENTDSVMYLTLPPKPSEDLSDEQLNQLARGGTASSTGTAGTFGTLCGTIMTVGSVGTASSFG